MMLSVYTIRATGKRGDFNCDDEHVIATQNSGDFVMGYVRDELMLAGFQDVEVTIISSRVGKFIPKVIAE